MTRLLTKYTLIPNSDKFRTESIKGYSRDFPTDTYLIYKLRDLFRDIVKGARLGDKFQVTIEMELSMDEELLLGEDVECFEGNITLTGESQTYTFDFEYIVRYINYDEVFRDNYD